MKKKKIRGKTILDANEPNKMKEKQKKKRNLTPTACDCCPALL
jgi:hypothetical protein